jgi:hypothetical protein
MQDNLLLKFKTGLLIYTMCIEGQTMIYSSVIKNDVF